MAIMILMMMMKDVDIDYNPEKWYTDGCMFQLNGDSWFYDSNSNEV